MAASGVYVIDAKKYRGHPHLKIGGGLFRPRVERLLVGSRDCTTLVDGVLKQVDVVRGLLGDDVSVHGVLCYIDADWPLVGGAFTIRGIQALWSKRLYPQLLHLAQPDRVPPSLALVRISEQLQRLEGVTVDPHQRGE